MNKIMKLSLCVFFLIFLSSYAFGETRVVNFDAGISTGVPLYGDKRIETMNRNILSDSGVRIILGGIADVNITLSDYFTFFTGCDLLCDANINKSSFFYHLDLAMFPGIKFYPGAGGLNISCAYSTGYRFDFLKTSAEGFEYDPSSWGNGFRLGVEYNFAYKNDHNWPSVGIYYRSMPRGNYQRDNILCVYCVVNF